MIATPNAPIPSDDAEQLLESDFIRSSFMMDLLRM